MKTSVNTEGASSPPAREAGWGVKIRADHGGGTERQGFGIPKRLENPSDGGMMAKTTGKTRVDAMNDRSNGKSQMTILLYYFKLILY